MAEQLYNDFEAWRYSDSPEFATMVGNHTFDDKLESYTLKSWQQRLETVSSFLERARQLNTNNDENLSIFIETLQQWIDGYNVKAFVFPLARIEGIHVDFPQVISYMRFKNEEDFEKYFKRLESIPEQIQGIVEVMREGIKSKLTMHAVSMKNVVEDLESIITAEITESCFYKPLKDLPESLKDNTELPAKAKAIIETKVVPAYTQLRDFIRDEYKPNCRKEIGISSIGGQEYYQQCLKHHLGYDISAQEVHQKGLDEVERINQDVRKVISELGLNMTPKEFAAHLRSSKEFYLDSEEKIKESYEKILYERIAPKLQEYFRVLPEAKLRLVLMDKSRAAGPAAYYIQGSTDGSRPGTFYINGNDPHRCPTYTLPALALHEANPGHHLQTSRLLETEGIPKFRTLMEDRMYTLMPVHFPMYTAYTEGWGLYSEFLGHEMGVYETPYERYGHYSQELLRAGRLVVDTGMHALGWSREKAVQFLLDNTSCSQTEIESEIDRYITWPGQACGYKIGELRIKELRNKAQTALGAKFHIADFHEVVMNHVGTLAYLEKGVDAYISNTLSK